MHHHYPQRDWYKRQFIEKKLEFNICQNQSTNYQEMKDEAQDLLGNIDARFCN